MKARFKSLLPAAIVSLIAFWAGAAFPQSGLGCVAEPVAGTSRQLLRCRNGTSIHVEAGARYTLIDRNQDGIADGVRLRRKALLLEVTRGLSGQGFVVITPQAIAAVRGTEWTVDVGGGKTSVFVISGTVGVQRPASSDGVSLRRGQGVDVASGSEPLVVKRWPQARVSALLARFGR